MKTKSLLLVILLLPFYLVIKMTELTIATVKTIRLGFSVGWNPVKMSVIMIKTELKQKEEVLLLIQKTALLNSTNTINNMAQEKVQKQIEGLKLKLEKLERMSL